MAFLDYNSEIDVPYTKEQVFVAIESSISRLKGMEISKIDKITGHILVKAGVSLFSWGENIPISLSELSNGYTHICITSTPKTGALFGGVTDLGKNRKNIEQIIEAISMGLKDMTPIEEIKDESNLESIDERLQKLKELLDNGFIDQNEYNDKKKDILATL